jgi:predicted nucleic acid-binding protein
VSDYYVDSSVLVKRHVFELGTNWFQHIADPASGNTILTAQISIVEVISAVQRRVREGVLTQADAHQIAIDVRALGQHEYHLIAITSAVIERACQLLERHPLRAYDAIQLAAALITDETYRAANLARAIFLSSDQRLRQAAIDEGLPTDDPSRYP